MVVEVSESSLRLDRGDKLRAYARGGIAHYWIVNLIDHRIEAYRDPGPEGYGVSAAHDRSARLPVTVDQAGLGSIAVAEILPAPEDEAGAHSA